MRRLIAVDATGGDWFVGALRRAWDEDDAVLPVDPRLPAPARNRLFARMRPQEWREAAGETAFVDGVPMEEGDALVIATSGTSGEPKGVVLTHDAVAASATATTTRIGVHGDDHWLACLPLAHVGGLSVVTRALATGARLTVHPGFDADAVAGSNATLVSLVPTALRRVDPARFRVVVLGGARPPAERPANVIATYGMTETGSGIVYDGRPLAGVDVALAADGRIRVRGPMLLRCYRLDDAEALDADGWFDTGDVGRWLHDGRLHVDGRVGDVIVTGGEKVWPDAVEAVLAPFGELAVAGVADAEWGQVVAAFVVAGPQPTPSLADVRAAVKAVLPAYAAPRILKVVDTLPRTPLGKIQRRLLTNSHGE